MLEDDNRAALAQLLNELIEKPIKEVQEKQVKPQLTKIVENLNRLSGALRSGDESVLEVSTEIRELDRQVLAEAGATTQILSELRHTVASLWDQQTRETNAIQHVLGELNIGLESLGSTRGADVARMRDALASLGRRLGTIQEEQAAAFVVSQKAKTDLQTFMEASQKGQSILQTTLETVIKRQDESFAACASLRRHVSFCATLLGLLIAGATAITAITRSWP
jgi:hypothetical protein